MNRAKLIIGAMIFCNCLGVSFNAMAVNCSTGLIKNKTVRNLTINGKKCYVFDSTIEGNISVRNSPRFLIHGSNIYGRVLVVGGEDIAIIDNVIENEKVIIRNTTGSVHLSNNEVKGDSNVVVGSNRAPETEVLVYGNKVSGNLKCKRNTLQVAMDNSVSGDHNCRSRRARLAFKQVEWTISPDDYGPGVHTIFMIVDVSPLAVSDVQDLGGRLIWNETQIELCSDPNSPPVEHGTFISIREVGQGFVRIGDGFQTNFQGPGCAINNAMENAFSAYGFPKTACLSVSATNVKREVCAPLEVQN